VKQNLKIGVNEMGIGCKYLGGTRLLKYVVHRNKYKWDSSHKSYPKQGEGSGAVVFAVFFILFILSLLR
jgi:hypothetical protein